jgi:hypothetical protein
MPFRLLQGTAGWFEGVFYMTVAVTDLLNPRRIDFDYEDAVTVAAVAPSRFFGIRALFHAARQLTLRHPAVIHYISDNGLYDDTASGEIRTRLNDAKLLLRAISARPAPHHEYHDIPPQDTNAAAFDLAQIGRGAVRGFGNIFFVNSAPRKNQRGKQQTSTVQDLRHPMVAAKLDGNAGETIFAGIMPNGAIVAGTGEEAFAHFKDLVVSGQLNLYETNVATDKTQFRSRDYFPWLAAVLGNYVNRIGVNRRWKSSLSVEQRDAILFGLNVVNPDRKLSADQIPDLLSNGASAARSDTHGNIKLNLRHPEIVKAVGGGTNPEVAVIANNRVLMATVGTESFAKPEGITVISAGSSGRWKGEDGSVQEPFAEVFTVGGRARDQLGVTDGLLKSGIDVHILPKRLFDYATSAINLSGRQASSDDVAASLVSSGLVHGLDHTVMTERIEDGTITTTLLDHLPTPRDNVVVDFHTVGSNSAHYRHLIP